MSSEKQYLRRTFDAALGLGLLLVVGWLDYATGYAMTMLVFYLVPVLFYQQRLGMAAGLVMAFLAGVVWLAADLAAGHHYADHFTPIWNSGVRISVFMLVVSLVSMRKELEIQVRQRTAKLREEAQERSRLEQELLRVAENEQRRIGHDLHDSLGQHLTATALAGKVLARKLSKESNPAEAAATHLVAMVEEAIQLTRHLAHSLHPLELDSSGLATALHNLALDAGKAFKVACHFENSASQVSHDRGTQGHLFRIAQEAVSNAVRHGQARNIVIALETIGDRTQLTITDDGVGLAENARQKQGFGMRIMDYRAKLIGGNCEIQNRPAGGVRVTCSLAGKPSPHHAHAAQDKNSSGG